MHPELANATVERVTLSPEDGSSTEFKGEVDATVDGQRQQLPIKVSFDPKTKRMSWRILPKVGSTQQNSAPTELGKAGLRESNGDGRSDATAERNSPKARTLTAWNAMQKVGYEAQQTKSPRGSLNDPPSLKPNIRYFRDVLRSRAKKRNAPAHRRSRRVFVA